MLRGTCWSALPRAKSGTCYGAARILARGQTVQAIWALWGELGRVHARLKYNEPYALPHSVACLVYKFRYCADNCSYVYWVVPHVENEAKRECYEGLQVIVFFVLKWQHTGTVVSGNMLPAPS